MALPAYGNISQIYIGQFTFQIFFIFKLQLKLFLRFLAKQSNRFRLGSRHYVAPESRPATVRFTDLACLPRITVDVARMKKESTKMRLRRAPDLSSKFRVGSSSKSLVT